MLSLADLLKFAEIKGMPAEKRRGILREYLQTLTLFFMQQAHFAPKMIFIGGTALRFMHHLERFSEDLDFNYRGTLKKGDLKQLMDHIKNEFGKEGIKVDFMIRKSQESYFNWKIYLQFPHALHDYQCGAKKGGPLHQLEKLSLQLDFQNLGQKNYPVTQKIIAHFGKRFLFNTTSLEMFLAEKSNAVLYRKSPRGRDFFDWMSLILWGAKINLSCLRQRDISVKSKKEYLEKIQHRVKQTDFTRLTKQLAPFLFHKEDIKIMESFPSHLQDLLMKIK